MPASVSALFLDRVAQTPSAEAYLFPHGTGWKSLTWKDVHDQVRSIAGGLVALGLKPEERVSILSNTRFDWIAADLAVLGGGGATTTIYPSSTAEECAYIINDSNSVFVFAEDDAQVAKLSAKRAELRDVRNVITFDGKPSADGWVLTLSQLEEKGRAHFGPLVAGKEDPFEKIGRSVTKDMLATLIYTSGTTGKPKGVELTHDCWVYEAEAIDGLNILRAHDVQYLWLPLAHSLGKVLQVAQLRIGFKSAVDGRADKMVENLAVIKPTFVGAVPRIFEKVHARIVGMTRDAGGAKWKIFQWALKVGKQASAAKQQGKSLSPGLALKNAIADKLVFSKIRGRFGGNLRYFISGSAPLSPELAEFFHAAGLLILEGYGLTETSAASFVNLPHQYRFGTVGPPLAGTEVKIAPEDGEILIRGRGVMRGYHNLPNETSETLDKDGWLHTGDIGAYQDGFLKITDRKKDLIKTSNGKYVAPQMLEAKLKLICPQISQVLVHGNNRSFCTALVALDDEAIKKWAKENQLGDLSYAQLAAHPKVKELIGHAVNQANAGIARHETVKLFSILPADLTLESGDLTPSMKLKRKAVEKKYQNVLDGFYAKGAGAD